MIDKLLHLFDRFGKRIAEDIPSDACDTDEDDPAEYMLLNRRSFFFMAGGLVVAAKAAPLISLSQAPLPQAPLLRQVSNVDLVTMQLEMIRPKLSLLFERTDVWYDRIESKTLEYPSRRTARAPLRIKP